MQRVLILSLLILLTFWVAGQPINVISFNIRFATENDGNNAWSLRKDAVIDFVNYEKADFIGLQEALLSQINDLENGANGYKWIGVGRDDGKEGGEFSPLFYSERWQLRKSGTFWLSETPEMPSKSWDAALPRICTWGEFRHIESGHTIYVFNTHYDHVGKEARFNASQIILKKIEEISGFRTTLLLGDLNASSNDEEIEIINASPLLDSFENSKITYGQEGTFNGFSYTEIAQRRIDYIFHSDDFSPLAYSTDSRVINGRYLSDHFPVIVTFIRR